MDFLIRLLALALLFVGSLEQGQAQGREIVEKIQKRWAGKQPAGAPEAPDSIGTRVSTSLEEDLRLGPEDSIRPPTSSVEALYARFLPLQIDSITDPRLLRMSEEEINEHIRQIDAMKPEATQAYTYAVAYYAQDEKMEKIETVNFGLRSARAILINRLTLMREKESKSLMQELDSLTLEDVYDLETKQFTRTDWLDRVKKSIFSSGRPQNIQTHAIGLLMPNAKDFGIMPRQGAVGYRLPLDQEHNLLIMQLEHEGTKAILWYSTPVWGTSRIVDVR